MIPQNGASRSLLRSAGPVENYDTKQSNRPPAFQQALVVLRPDELHAIIRDAVAEALEVCGTNSQPEPLTVSGAEMAKRLGVSRTTLYRLRVNDGCPAVKLGDAWRYQPRAVQAWLDTRRQQ